MAWFYTCITRLTVTVKLEAADADGLRRTLQTANGACHGISEQAWHAKTFRQLALDKGVYYQVRERFGLSAQMAVPAIAKLVDAYALDNRTKPMFRKDGAFRYDERILRRAQAVHRASFLLHDLHREPVEVWATSRKEKQLRHADLTLSIFGSGLHRYR